MKKGIFLFLFLFSIFNVHAQDFTISFEPKEISNQIDSIWATNLRTNQIVRLLRGESLLLGKNYTSINLLNYNLNKGYVFPNPTNDDATFCFSIERSQEVKIGLFNSSGQLLNNIVQNLSEGSHSYYLKFPSEGIYFISLICNDGNLVYKSVYTGSTIQNSSIIYAGSEKLISNNTIGISLKSLGISKTLGYTAGDVVQYTFYSNKNRTILSDIPVASETIDVEFTSCTDLEDRSYKVVKIGTQWWMAENLAYLPKVNPPTLGSDNLPFYYIYGYSGTDVKVAKSTLNYATYGVLYNWTAAKSACPSGWHLPSDSEWKQLEEALGMTQVQADNTDWRGTDQGKQIKATIGWNNSGNGTNTSGFTALPAGYRYSDGLFRYIGTEGCWWTSTDFSVTEPWYHFVVSPYSKINRNHNYTFREFGWSVRCVKN